MGSIIQNLMKKYEPYYIATKAIHTLEIPKVPELYKPKPNPYAKDYYNYK